MVSPAAFNAPVGATMTPAIVEQQAQELQQQQQQEQQQGHEHQEGQEHQQEQQEQQEVHQQASEQQQEQQPSVGKLGRTRSLDTSGPQQQQQQQDSSLIVRFYRDGAHDSMHRTLRQMLQYDDINMERCHDHMQWMFPLHEPSMFAVDYEILSERDVQELSSSAQARANMAAAAAHFSAFLGLGPSPQPGKWRSWARNGNHNLLRITRVIRSLRLFGMEEVAQQVYDAALEVSLKHHLSPDTVRYWTTALTGPPMGSLRNNGSNSRAADGQTHPRTIMDMLLGMRK